MPFDLDVLKHYKTDRYNFSGYCGTHSEEIIARLEAGEACRAALENLITAHGGPGGKLEYSAWIADAKDALRRAEDGVR